MAVTAIRPTYPELLEQLWQAHLAERLPGAPTVVSTFAGCGGSSLGYSGAGYREVLASEWDAHACGVFRRNFPHVPLVEGDVTDLAVDQALELTGLQPGELTVFDGSPPCQGFSPTGRRDLADPRSRLFEQYVRLVEGLQPQAVVMENVSGMVQGKMRATFVEVLRAMRQAAPGYRVAAALMDSSYFGAATRRQRLIFLGYRADLNLEPVHPPGRGPVYTVHDAIADLDDPGLYAVPRGKSAALAAQVPQGGLGSEVLERAGKYRSDFGMRRAAWHRPGYTIIKTTRPAQGAGMLHPSEQRFLGLRELARLQSFPDAFDWGPAEGERGYVDVHARIGNSVPPLLMHAVGQHIRTTLEGASP